MGRHRLPPWTTFLFVLALALVLGCKTPPSSPSGQGDPGWSLAGDTFAHDPSLIHTADGYHLYYTGPGIQTKTSPDGHRWTEAHAVFNKIPGWWKSAVPAMTFGDVWAPDVSSFDGRFVLFYSISSFGSNTSAIGVAVADTLEGDRWTDQGLVIASKDSSPYNCIDPNLFVDDDGSPWLVFGSFWTGIYLTALDPQTLKPVGKLTNVSARPGSEPAEEAPFLVHTGDWYYLFTSRDYCCRGVDSTYKIAVARSATLAGPYVDKAGRPALKGGGTIVDQTAKRYIGPGGQSVYRDNGQWLLVHHFYDRDANGRATLKIHPLYFDADGWPSLTKP
jgi:arabinan endo-1,5-alpha-L-arabinosidase